MTATVFGVIAGILRLSRVSSVDYDICQFSQRPSSYLDHHYLHDHDCGNAGAEHFVGLMQNLHCF